MEKVGAYEAKTHLPQLLQRVAKGERIVITRHGLPVATLQGAEGTPSRPLREIIEDLKAFRLKHKLDGISIKEMISEGRR